MLANKVSEFLYCIGALFDRFSEAIKYQFCFITEKLIKNIVLIFKIEINCAVSDPCRFGNLGNGRLKKSLFGKYLCRRLKDTVVFVICFSFCSDRKPPSCRAYLKYE